MIRDIKDSQMNHANKETEVAMRTGGAKAAAPPPLPMVGGGAMLSNSTAADL